MREALHDVYLPLHRFREIVRGERAHASLRHQALAELVCRNNLHRIPDPFGPVKTLDNCAEGPDSQHVAQVIDLLDGCRCPLGRSVSEEKSYTQVK